MSEIKGKIHSYESLAALDGDGIRLAVFMRGCPLRCAYCHNPDTWEYGGADTPTDEVVKKALRLKPYFLRGGGVTFSGGEPLLQAKFVAQTGEALKAEGINYALDTSGAVELSDDVKQAANGAELVILDIKFPDSQGYLEYCGGGFDKVMAVGDFIDKLDKRIWLRTVIVPDINDKESEIERYADVARRWKNIERYELLPFHTMGFSKYRKTGIPNKLSDTPPLDSNRLNQLRKFLDGLFFNQRPI